MRFSFSTRARCRCPFLLSLPSPSKINGLLNQQLTRHPGMLQDPEKEVELDRHPHSSRHPIFSLSLGFRTPPSAGLICSVAIDPVFLNGVYFTQRNNWPGFKRKQTEIDGFCKVAKAVGEPVTVHMTALHRISPGRVYVP